ncbi:MAG: hypothetical protein GXY33_06790 [Phycisphaerae bacterium]|nr:hypothetical protein [Phycisphaerae bacterium]
MNLKKRQEWEKIREQGMWRFVLREFVVRMGLCVGVLTAAGRTILTDGLLPTQNVLTNLGLDLALCVPVFAAVGLAYGLGEWCKNDQLYTLSCPENNQRRGF